MLCSLHQSKHPPYPPVIGIKTIYHLIMTKMSDIQEWLDANVVTHNQPKNISLSGFEIDWNDLSGSFDLAFDETVLSERIKFSLESNGRMKFWMPMFHSPLGAPASYAAFEMSDSTKDAIDSALYEAFSSFRPMGWNKDIDVIITSSTPMLERVFDQARFSEIKKVVGSKGYSISRAVK